MINREVRGRKGERRKQGINREVGGKKGDRRKQGTLEIKKKKGRRL